MTVEKFNEEVDKVKPYELTDKGELIEIVGQVQQDFRFSKNYKKPFTYLTDDEYSKLKNLSDNTKVLCELLDEQKKQYVDLMKGAIQKIKSDSNESK